MPDLLTIAQIGSVTTAALGLITTLITRTTPWIRTKLTSRAVTRRLGTILTEGQVERAVRYYVAPMCQDVDPAGAEEPRLVFGVRQKLFDALDQALTHPTEFRYIFLLADSGMGKSSALINYYARNLRRLRRDFEIELVPLGIPNADDRIAAITDKASKVLFLDAFDEDTLAIVDHLERLRNLLTVTKEFRRVLITCRTQFFGKDEEIPVRTGVIKVGARGPGEPAEYFFHKIYLSPFGDAEIESYIQKRYPAWRPKLRRQAFCIVARIPNLAVRPMLLEHVDLLVNEHREVQSSAELYEEMIEAWLRREEGFIRNKDDLRRFSESLAVDIYLNRERRGAERVTRGEIEILAQAWKIPIESWALTGRSLLNRDAEGSYKFAHRSIMEYLFVRAFFRDPSKFYSFLWTDQMRAFFSELVGYTGNIKAIILPLLNNLNASELARFCRLCTSDDICFVLAVTEDITKEKGKKVVYRVDIIDTLNSIQKRVFVSADRDNPGVGVYKEILKEVPRSQEELTFLLVDKRLAVRSLLIFILHPLSQKTATDNLADLFIQASVGADIDV